MCHGADGQGRSGPNGEHLFPALWRPKSFNIGAGMARVSNAAGFVKTNMPVGQGNTLSDADAFDVAAFSRASPVRISRQSPATGRGATSPATLATKTADYRKAPRTTTGMVFVGRHRPTDSRVGLARRDFNDRACLLGPSTS